MSKKIKKLVKKHRFRRWLRRLFGIKPRASDLLANIDEMHEVPVELPPMYFVCPCCGTMSPMGTLTTKIEKRIDRKT